MCNAVPSASGLAWQIQHVNGVWLVKVLSGQKARVVGQFRNEQAAHNALDRYTAAEVTGRGESQVVVATESQVRAAVSNLVRQVEMDAVEATVAQQQVVTQVHTARKSDLWSSTDDELLRQAIAKHGGKNWKAIAEDVPPKSAIQCLHHWRKVLDPTIVKGAWTAADCLTVANGDIVADLKLKQQQCDQTMERVQHDIRKLETGVQDVRERLRYAVRYTALAVRWVMW